MYGLIGKMIAVEGKRDELLALMLGATGAMPGCRLYVLATDPSDANAIWITEAWDSEAAHRASLTLPEVQATIARARPLIAGFGERFVTTPVGGVGLTSGPET
jgi:quinol monooxygenase YgiN